MNVLVDTTVWSLAFRRKHSSTKDQVIVDELSELIRELRAKIIGPIRQEILSGIPEDATFERVRESLLPFEDVSVEPQDYEEAARMYNTCRRKGVQGSHIDYLICAVSTRTAAPIFTTDRDFAHYAKIINIPLYETRHRQN